MEYVTKREINNKNRHDKYMQIYNDVKSGMSWTDLAHKYGYKNAASMSSTYYLHIVPILKNLNKAKAPPLQTA